MIGFYFLNTIKTLELGLLHSFRRVEYMVIFFIVYQSVNLPKQAKLLLKGLVLVLLIVSLYGIGQKYLGWPAIQTMNPHYAKGYLLTLDANARISSTFGGHYDLAAYLVVLMPLALGMYISTKKRWYLIAFTAGLISLILTASRASFVAYLAVVPLLLLYLRKFKLLTFVILATLLLTPISQDLTKRINRTFRQELVWVNESGQTIVPREITANDLPPGDFVIKNKKGTDTNEEGSEKEVKQVKKELRNSIVEQARRSGKELTENELESLVDQAFAEFSPVSSVLPDISFATRLQVEWPRAVKAFLKNPLTGSGPSSITEATDNDFLRSIGEVGVFGFGLFFFVVFSLIIKTFKKFRSTTVEYRAFYLSIVAGIMALLINALYIDVFEASKVAFVIWFIWGLALKLSNYKNKEQKEVFSK
jgi:hypothetical protein